MTEKKVPQIDCAELRRFAEEQLGEKPGTDRMIGEDPLRLLHELQVHKIELEQQVEELRQSRAEVEASLDALRESETRYRSLFNNMLEGFAFCRMLLDGHGRPADFVYLDVNSAFGSLTGLKDVTGKKVTEVIPGIKESDPELFEIYGRVALTGQPEKIEIYVEALGIWFSISVYSPERGYFVAIFDNITERKRTGVALSRSEAEAKRLLHELHVHQVELEMQNAELRQAREELETALEMYIDLYDFAPVGYVTLDRQGTISRVNLKGAGLMGVERSRLVGQRFGLFITAAARPAFAHFLGKIFISTAKEACEVTLLKEGNAPLCVQIEGVAAESGQECRVALIDITERKRAEEELRKAKDDLELLVRARTEDLQATMDSLSSEMAERERAAELLRLSEERYRKVVADQTETICRFNADGTFTFVNDVFCRVFGKAREELLGSKWYPRVFPEDVPIIEERLRTMSPANPVVVVENRVYNDSGAIRWLQAVNRGFFDENGELVETQGVARDITEQKLAEEELQRVLEIAETANNTMRRLVRTIAHEFRTPLGLLIGSTDILDRYWDRLIPEKRAEQLELIQNASYQISNLVNSVTVFNLSGMDRPGEPPQLQDIGDLCRSIAAEVETVWCAGHEFIVSIAANCGTAVIDYILFRQILQNLLSNACRYTMSNGVVSLQACREKNKIVLEITDTGIGIPKEEQALIFDAFYRSRNVEGRRGLGLGLSIVREALAQMGGTITVTSSMGEGTTMRVEIPVVDSM